MVMKDTNKIIHIIVKPIQYSYLPKECKKSIQIKYKSQDLLFYRVELVMKQSLDYKKTILLEVIGFVYPTCSVPLRDNSLFRRKIIYSCMLEMLRIRLGKNNKNSN